MWVNGGNLAGPDVVGVRGEGSDGRLGGYVPQAYSGVIRARKYPCVIER
jgi:hypothetical protein